MCVCCAPQEKPYTLCIALFLNNWKEMGLLVSDTLPSEVTPAMVSLGYRKFLVAL